MGSNPSVLGIPNVAVLANPHGTNSLYMGCAVNLPVGSSAQRIWWANVGGSGGVQYNVNAAGAINVFIHGVASATSASGLFRFGQRNYCELYISSIWIGNSGPPNFTPWAGIVTATAWLNGIQVVTVSTYPNNICFDSSIFTFTDLELNFNPAPQQVGSVYVLDNTGSYDNTQRGDNVVGFLGPSGAGHETGWTPNGAAANWQCVSDNPPDDDTTYVSSSTVGQKDMYTLASVPANIASLTGGVQIVTDVRQDAAGTRQVTPGMSNGSSDDFTGAPVAPTTSYAIYTTPYSSNPFTSSAWALGDLASLQVGPELTN